MSFNPDDYVKWVGVEYKYGGKETFVLEGILQTDKDRYYWQMRNTETGERHFLNCVGNPEMFRFDKS